MTWFSYENYGTVLQAIALQRILSHGGAEPFLIDYSPRATKERCERVDMVALAKKAVGKFKDHSSTPYHSSARSELFAAFLTEYAETSEPVNSAPELRALASSAAACICGSDQVWSPTCFDENYFLPFVDDPAKRIAYAPSFGASNIVDPEIRQRTAELVGGFGSLSARESRGVELIGELAGRKAELVLDPTLLFDYAGWKDLLGGGSELEKPNKYVLCYFLGDPSRYRRAVSSYAEFLGLPIIVIPTFNDQRENVPPFEVGPKEYVELLSGASYVLTDSFHGVAFATNFNKPFSVFKRFSDSDQKSQNSRITGFLELMRLSERLVDPEGALASETCDFSIANRALEDLRRSSMAYLEKSLEIAFKTYTEGEKPKKPIHITDQCCGCGACAVVCPRKAVAVSENVDGFQAYSIDDGLCVACGACVKVCPMATISAPSLRNALGMCSYKSADKVSLTMSSSGGLCNDLSVFLLAKDYRVFGCAYDREQDAAVVVEVDEDKVNSLKGSKYIQARSAEALAKASDGDGRVAFFGTPCQIAGLDALLRQKSMRDSAVLVELICRGVPTANLWRRYIEERVERDGVGRHPDVQFRWKANGWSSVKMMRVMGGARDYSAAEPKDDFYAFFGQGLCNAKSCYECPYRERSAADVRTGDYWGPRFSDDCEGVSMAVVMTERGRAIVEELANLGAEVNAQKLQEYWDCQQPYNQGLPIMWGDIIVELARGDKALSALRRRYCGGYDQRRRLMKAKAVVKKILGHG